MKVIVGHTRSRKMIGRLKQLGWRRCMIDRKLDPWKKRAMDARIGAYKQAAANARALGFTSVDAMLAAGHASTLKYDFDVWFEQLISSGDLGSDARFLTSSESIQPGATAAQESSSASALAWLLGIASEAVVGVAGRS